MHICPLSRGLRNPWGHLAGAEALYSLGMRFRVRFAPTVQGRRDSKIASVGMLSAVPASTEEAATLRAAPYMLAKT